MTNVSDEWERGYQNGLIKGAQSFGPRITAERAAGRAEALAEVVAWLREDAAKHNGKYEGPLAASRLTVADAIENREHR